MTYGLTTRVSIFVSVNSLRVREVCSRLRTLGNFAIRVWMAKVLTETSNLKGFFRGTYGNFMRPSELRHVLNNFDFEHFLHLRLKTVWESKNHKLVLWVKKLISPQIIIKSSSSDKTSKPSWAEQKSIKKHVFFQKWKFPSNSKQGTGSQRPICFPKTQILLRKTISNFLRLKRSLLRKSVKAKSFFFQKTHFSKNQENAQNHT